MPKNSNDSSHSESKTYKVNLENLEKKIEAFNKATTQVDKNILISELKKTPPKIEKEHKNTSHDPGRPLKEAQKLLNRGESIQERGRKITGKSKNQNTEARKSSLNTAASKLNQRNDRSI